MQKGFTLLEMMVVLTIGVILMTMGIPGFNQLFSDNRTNTVANVMVKNFTFARNQAVNQGNLVTVCALATDNTCDGGTACKCTANWSAGMDVFIDVNGDGVVNSADTVLQSGQPFSSNDTLVSSPTSVTFLTFRPDGLPNNFTNVNFRYCTGNNASTVGVEVSPTGRASQTDIINCN